MGVRKILEESAIAVGCLVTARDMISLAVLCLYECLRSPILWARAIWLQQGHELKYLIKTKHLQAGFGENSRVLKWVVERIDGQAGAVETPIGHVPTLDALDTDGLDMTREQLEEALRVDVEEWKAEIPQITEWFEKFGDTLPATLWTELDGLKARLGA